jgi:hypothetical protein
MKNLIGKRVELISMVNDPHPIESGTLGTIYHYGFGVINVKWDNGRTLGLIEGEDTYEILEGEEWPEI